MICSEDQSILISSRGRRFQKFRIKLQILIYEDIWKELWEKERGERKGFLILRYSDGRVQTQLFGDLGVIAGKETVSFSHYVWVKGLFDR